MKTAEFRKPIVEVKNLKMYFPITRGLLRRKVGDIKAIDDVSFQIKRHETLGLVGESGCGKTTTGRCILRCTNPPPAGEYSFNGQDISKLPERKIRPLRSSNGQHFPGPLRLAQSRARRPGISWELPC